MSTPLITPTTTVPTGVICRYGATLGVSVILLATKRERAMKAAYSMMKIARNMLAKPDLPPADERHQSAQLSRQLRRLGAGGVWCPHRDPPLLVGVVGVFVSTVVSAAVMAATSAVVTVMLAASASSTLAPSPSTLSDDD